MELRSQKTISRLIVLAGCASALANPIVLQVRHAHLRGSGAGTLTISDRGISFVEAGKRRGHSRDWRYDDIEQLRLEPGRLSVLTYEDRKWLLGRDREFVFYELPENSLERLNALFRDSLDQRFVAALAASDAGPLWSIPVKMLRGGSGVDGVLVAGREHLAFESDRRGESRTWRYTDLTAVSSSSPFELRLSTYEIAGVFHSGARELEFQLKQPLSEARYNQLWRAVEEANGLKTFHSEL